MKIRHYLDEDSRDQALVRGLRAHGVDMLAALDTRRRRRYSSEYRRFSAELIAGEARTTRASSPPRSILPEWVYNNFCLCRAEVAQMPVPDYEAVMLPLLKLAGDGKEHSRREAVDRLGKSFNLSDQELVELLPSGTQAVFYNRIGWAKTYLTKAGLLTSTKRPYFKITPRGLEVLKQNPGEIDYKFLEKFPEFIEFRKPSLRITADGQVVDHPLPLGQVQPIQGLKQQTPEEALEYAYQEIRKDLANELLEQMQNCDPSFFEKLVVQLLVAMGYGGSVRDAGQAIGQTGDDGIDGVIKQDPLGLDVVYIQAKKWKQRTVGQPDIQQFVGALHGKHASKGVFITTSTFSNPAFNYTTMVASTLILIDGLKLAQLMIDYEIGVSKAAVYNVSKIDLGYFSDD